MTFIEKLIAGELRQYMVQKSDYFDEENIMIRYPKNKVLQCMALREVAMHLKGNRGFSYKELVNLINKRVSFNGYFLVEELMKYGFLWRCDYKYYINPKWPTYYNSFLGMD